MHTARRPRWLDAALGCLTGALSAAAFALSFEALHELATRAGVTDPFAALLPLIIDGTAVVATLAVLSDTLLGRASRWPWAVVASASLVSLTGNLLHAQPLAIAWFVAALRPVALMTSLEMLMRQLRTRMTPPPEPASPATSICDLDTNPLHLGRTADAASGLTPHQAEPAARRSRLPGGGRGARPRGHRAVTRSAPGLLRLLRPAPAPRPPSGQPAPRACRLNP